MDFVGSTGWFCGDHGTMRKSTDGGNSWFSLPQNTNLRLECIDFVDESTGWVVGGYTGSGTILKSTDGGMSWDSQLSSGSLWLLSVEFLNADTGWVTGADGVMLFTTNGGGSWNPMSSGVNTWILDIAIVAPGILVAVGDNGRVLRSTDWGTSWAVEHSIAGVRLESVSFSSPERGWAVGSNGSPTPGVIIRTTDGGVTWVAQESGCTEGFFGVYFADENTGWAAGYHGSIIGTTSGGDPLWVPGDDNAPLPARPRLVNYPNPFNGSTVLQYSVPENGPVSLHVFDVLGREIAGLVDEVLPAGEYRLAWQSSPLPSGVYFSRLISAGRMTTRKMLLVR
jgi:photosystem II stability/assembly factor-like uncharacterized protein